MNFTLINKTVLICAKRKSGKSYLLKYLTEYEQNTFYKIYVICPTEAINNFYSSIIPKSQIYDAYSEKWTEELINKMTTINSNKLPNEKVNVLLILDDCIADTDFHNSLSLKKLFVRVRHINIAIIITTQYLNSIPPIARNNSDYILVGQLNKQSIQILIDEYLAGNITKQEFTEYYRKATNNYGFMVINGCSVKDNNNANEIYGIIRTPREYLKNI